MNLVKNNKAQVAAVYVTKSHCKVIARF